MATYSEIITENTVVPFSEELARKLAEKDSNDVFHDAFICPECGQMTSDWESCGCFSSLPEWKEGIIGFYYEVDDYTENLYLVWKGDEICERCKNVAEAIEIEAAVDPRFHRKEWIHSLDAYRGKGADTIHAHFEAFDCLESGAEVCCSDIAHMVGTVALVLTGTVTGVLSYDASSCVDPQTGKRYATRAEPVSYEDFAPDADASYYEGWLKNTQVEEVLVKECILDCHPRRWTVAKRMAQELGVNIRVFETGKVVFTPIFNSYEELPKFQAVWAC